MVAFVVSFPSMAPDGAHQGPTILLAVSRTTNSSQHVFLLLFGGIEAVF